MTLLPYFSRATVIQQVEWNNILKFVKISILDALQLNSVDVSGGIDESLITVLCCTQVFTNENTFSMHILIFENMWKVDGMTVLKP